VRRASRELVCKGVFVHEHPLNDACRLSRVLGPRRATGRSHSRRIAASCSRSTSSNVSGMTGVSRGASFWRTAGSTAFGSARLPRDTSSRSPARRSRRSSRRRRWCFRGTRGRRCRRKRRCVWWCRRRAPAESATRAGSTARSRSRRSSPSTARYADVGARRVQHVAFAVADVAGCDRQARGHDVCALSRRGRAMCARRRGALDHDRVRRIRRPRLHRNGGLRARRHIAPVRARHRARLQRHACQQQRRLSQTTAQIRAVRAGCDTRRRAARSGPARRWRRADRSPDGGARTGRARRHD